MSIVRIELPASIPEDLAIDVARQAVHAARGVRSLRWDTERRIARVETDPGTSADDVLDKVRRLVTGMASRYRPLPKKVLCTNARRDRGPLVADVERRLSARGFVRELGPGQVALSGPALAFAAALDARLAAIAKGRFGAREEAYPSLIPAEVLRRCGYLASFPHTATMVTHLAEDIDAIERFRKANRDASALVVPEPEALAPPRAFLSPAVCYHFYPSIEGSRLAAPLEVVTASGRCFRYESRNMRGLERLWDFAMREVVFCGGDAPVASMRERLMEVGLGLACDLDLDLRIESARDPFSSADPTQRPRWQARGDLKFEVLVAIPPAEDGRPRATAAASFNLHEDFFGRAFRFEAEGGSPGFTGCAAWGLSRWVLAAFAQHGLEPARWPEAWRQDVFA